MDVSHIITNEFQQIFDCLQIIILHIVTIEVHHSFEVLDMINSLIDVSHPVPIKKAVKG